MTKSLDVFCEIPCLTEQSRQLSGIVLQKKWFKSADKRNRMLKGMAFSIRNWLEVSKVS